MTAMPMDNGERAVLSSGTVTGRTARKNLDDNYVGSALDTESSASVGRLCIPSLQLIPTITHEGSVAIVASLQEDAQSEDRFRYAGVETQEPANGTCKEVLLASAIVGSRDYVEPARDSRGTLASSQAVRVPFVSEVGQYDVPSRFYKESDALVSACKEQCGRDPCHRSAGRDSNTESNALCTQVDLCHERELPASQRDATICTLAYDKYVKILAGQERGKSFVPKVLISRRMLTRAAATMPMPLAYSERRRMSGCEPVVQTRVENRAGIKPYLCEKCGQLYKRPYLLKIHMRSHTGDKPHACDDCGKTFATKSHVTMHMLTHAREKLHVCGECGQGFSRKSHLRVHTLIHTHEKPHECEACGQRFARKDSLTLHMLRHTNEKPHVCSECGQRFARKDGMTIHMLTHTHEKPHVCSICGQSFVRKSSMNRHVLAHAREKPHACSECGRRFMHKSSVAEHIRSHTRVKPHVCSECGQTFARKGKMAMHMLAHTGEKPHVCSECGRRFLRKDVMKKHMLIHTRE